MLAIKAVVVAKWLEEAVGSNPFGYRNLVFLLLSYILSFTTFFDYNVQNMWSLKHVHSTYDVKVNN